MRIDWWTLGIQAANVLVLMWLLSRFLFRPVAQMIAERRAEIARLIDDATAAKAEAQAELDAVREKEADIAAERNTRLEQAAEAAEAQKATILASAESEVKDLRAAADAAIARAWDSEKEAASDHASRLAVDITAKLLARLPEEARISGFVDGLAEGLAELAPASRAAFGADGPVRLKAARALTEAEAEACRTRLSEVLGRPLTFEMEVDPGLIAGLEIETPHAVVRNNFKADLDRITAALTQHGS